MDQHRVRGTPVLVPLQDQRMVFSTDIPLQEIQAPGVCTEAVPREQLC